MALYDELYEKGQKIIEKHNPCGLKIDSTGKASCISSRGEVEDKGQYIYRVPDDGDLCCGGCRYLTKKGCKAKCLCCKLYLCSNFPEKHPAKVELLELRKMVYRRIDFMFSIRRSRKLCIQDASGVLKDRMFYGFGRI